tara:strand:- start:5184 stop:5927 length:744 start_codon:yes stop_codon:yes gene_type:complete
MKFNDMAILYVNSHHSDFKYVAEANKSAASFKQYLPNAKYYLYTDKAIKDPTLVSEFDEVRVTDFSYPDFMKDRVHLNGQMVAKHRAMLELEEPIVMYLGADTYALKNSVSSLPKLMEKFDIALAHAPVRINTELGNSPIEDVPECFPELNCDIILYRNNEGNKELIRRWAESYLNDEFGHPHDQGPFRYYLYHSDLRLYVLPPEFNYREFEFRADTAILQNRFVLHEYLEPQPQGFLSKIKKRLFN